MATMRARRPHARVAAPLAWLTTVIVTLGLLAGGTAQAVVRDRSAAAVESVQTGQAADSVVKAADLSQFQAGNIISDAVFYNQNTMSSDQIQAFLQSKVPTCQSGYTCLKDWYDTSRTTTADAMCGAYSGGVRERASTIIFKVAQACGINPQVLVVMLQKEQGLVTHTWPSDWRYTIAMGQGCPDTAACDTRYYGFFNQVYGAAWQLKRYGNPPGTSQYFTWFAPGKTWNVRYHPNVDCGSSPVLIQNQATANLYYYTPYQPNAAALRAGTGEGDGCSAYGNRNFYNYFTDWFGTSQSPFGNIELVEARPGQFAVSGWVADPNTSDPLAVHVYVGSAGYAIAGDIDRADVAAAYPGLGTKHGFSASFPASGSGSVSVCIYAINVGFGGNVLLGCRSVTAMSGSPTGELETAVGVDGGVQVTGWAIDPDTVSPAAVHVYVDSTGVGLAADGARPDIAARYPAYGEAHGFATTVPASPGSHSVCAYGINSGPGGNVALACRTVIVPGSVDLGRAPVGNFEGLTVDGNVANASGWALDPDTTSSIPVHIYVGSVGKAYTADKPRNDVGAVYAGYGANHGFAEQLTLPAGRSSVCAYAINTGAGGHTFLGCRTVDVGGMPDLGRAPIGNFEAATAAAGGATVSGWAIDQDTTASISVHIYVDSTGGAYTADKSRADVAAVYSGYGDKHGFVEFIPMSSGAHRVCVYPINTGAGGNTWLGCRDVTVP
ncbi:hypothetical protein [Microbacterium sp. P5_E9]